MHVFRIESTTSASSKNSALKVRNKFLVKLNDKLNDDPFVSVYLVLNHSLFVWREAAD